MFSKTLYSPGTGAWGLGTVTGYPCAGDVSSLFDATDMPEHAEGHNGTDIAAPSGTPICAPCNMVITDVFSLDVQSTVPLFKQIKEWFGNSVWGIFTGPDGNQYRTMFAHMESSPVVREGQSVAAGTVLGYVGSTGLSTGPHLHWTVGPASNRWLARNAGNFEALNWAVSGDTPEVQVTQQTNYDVNALTDALNKVQAAINDLRIKIDGMR